MSNITESRKYIQNEETAPQAAVSESTMTRVGAAINFINTYQNKEWFFGPLGPYGDFAMPIIDKGSTEDFHENAEIINVRCTIGDPGSSGTNEIDLEWSADGVSWASIFSTTPKCDNTAAIGDVFDSEAIVPTPTGCTPAVLSKTTFDTGDRLRCKMVSAGTGAETFNVAVIFRPI